MPDSTSTRSKPEDEGSSDRSVLDLLYHDSRRIGSFLSQFEGDGHLQELTRTKEGTRGKTDGSKKEGGGSLGIGSLKLEGAKETSLSMTEGYARVFDPYWSNARAFLNHPSENDMLNRDLLTGRIGQFVLAEGFLSILDLGMMKNAWSMPSIIKKVLGADEAIRPPTHASPAQKAEFKRLQKEEQENKALTLDLMQLLPHSVHATLLTGNEGEDASMVWGSLREEYLVVPPGEIILAHGARMPGRWSIVGILTALPEWTVPDLNGASGDVEIGVLASMVGQVSQQLAPIVRFALGRPSAAYAVTPLLIYRAVA